MEKPKYYKFIKKKKDDNDFTFNKIYKIRNANNLESGGNFIDDKGRMNGYSGKNYKHFIPATEEEYFKQENIIIVKPMKYNYNKLQIMLNFINNYGK